MSKQELSGNDGKWHNSYLLTPSQKALQKCASLKPMALKAMKRMEKTTIKMSEICTEH
jgi:hypothetical protein